MDLPIRYAKNGEINIACAVIGSGPPDLVFIQGSITNLGVLWEDARYRGWCEQLASFRRLILFDKRGMGLSDRVEAGTMEDRMDDVRAVMDAIGSERAVIMGVSEGGLMATLFAASHPDRTESLILLGAETCEENDETWAWGDGTREEFEGWMADWSRWGQGTGLRSLAPTLVDADPLGATAWFGKLQLQAGNPRTIEAHNRASFGTDTRSILSTIHVPTLVLHRSDDTGVNVNQGRYLAEHIPGARYVELPGVDHLPWVNGEDILGEIQEFVTGLRPLPDADRMLATVLFTDIVASTERVTELGDRRWGALLVAHHAAMRRELERFKGQEVDTAGDGFLATFDGPTRAVRCALSAVRAARGLGLHVRAGLHTGEVVRVGGKPGGVAVHIGARVAALAAADEVLVSSTVRDLAAGSEIAFTDMGSRVLKGVPGEWRIYGVK
jgi:pimeloyl-ACP methyl ester carboxylesterase/class 3 adenylate cyclase